MEQPNMVVPIQLLIKSMNKANYSLETFGKFEIILLAK